MFSSAVTRLSAHRSIKTLFDLKPSDRHHLQHQNVNRFIANSHLFHDVGPPFDCWQIYWQNSRAHSHPRQRCQFIIDRLNRLLIDNQSTHFNDDICLDGFRAKSFFCQPRLPQARQITINSEWKWQSTGIGHKTFPRIYFCVPPACATTTVDLINRLESKSWLIKAWEGHSRCYQEAQIIRLLLRKTVT